MKNTGCYIFLVPNLILQYVNSLSFFVRSVWFIPQNLHSVTIQQNTYDFCKFEMYFLQLVIDLIFHCKLFMQLFYISIFLNRNLFATNRNNKCFWMKKNMYCNLHQLENQKCVQKLLTKMVLAKILFSWILLVKIPWSRIPKTSMSLFSKIFLSYILSSWRPASWLITLQ